MTIRETQVVTLSQEIEQRERPVQWWRALEILLKAVYE